MIFSQKLVPCAALFAGLLGLACSTPSLDKPECRRDDDCVAGRACVAGTCSARMDAASEASADAGRAESPSPDGGESADVRVAPDATSPPGRDGGDSDVADAAADAGAEGGLADRADGSLADRADGSLADRADGSPADGAMDGRADGAEGGHPDAGEIAPNLVFTTSRRVLPMFDSPASADAVCNSSASAAGLPGDFRAWLSTTKVNARDRLAGARGWIRPDGLPFADTVDDLVAGRIFHPAGVDEAGRKIPLSLNADDYVMTGTGELGLLDPGSNCGDWQSGDSGDVATSGIVNGATRLWTRGYWTTCVQMAHMLCFGIDHVARVSVVRQSGRIAFVTQGSFMPGNGLPVADALCQSEATAAGFKGSFLALLATSTRAAADRFTVTRGDVWVRPDGVPLTTSSTSLFDDVPLAAPNVTADGQYVYRDVVLTGAATPRALPKVYGTCNDWQSMNVASGAEFGWVALPDLWFSTHGSTACSLPVPIYCLQQ